MFEDAVRTLAAIDEALGIGGDGCADPEQTLEAIAELKMAAARREELVQPEMACNIAKNQNEWFKREKRYVVLKNTDIKDYLSDDEIASLQAIENKVVTRRLVNNKQPFEAVVIEKDWPEFELAWASIKARTAGKVMDDLTQLVARLAQSLRKAAPGHELTEKALDYLQREGLTGLPLRDTPSA